MNAIKDYKLVWYNFSGDVFFDMYTEDEAYTLYDNKKVTSVQVELIPPYGNTCLVWNRNCNREFECWK